MTRTSNDYFWAGWGLTAYFFHLPLTRMMVVDTQYLYLGGWDWRGWWIFLLLTYAVIPAVVGLSLAALSRKSTLGAKALLVVWAAQLASSQLAYFVVARRVENPLWIGFGEVAAFTLGAAVLWAAFTLFLEGLKVCSLITIGCALAFAYSAAPSRARGILPRAPAPAGMATEGQPPVFILTFEKLVSSYFTDDRGRILDHFPNIKRLASESDYYPNAYANSNGTVMALTALYTGRNFTGYWALGPRNSGRHLRDIVGENRKVYMLLDLLNYCAPGRDVCIRSIGNSALTNLDIIQGWYKTYAKTTIPRTVHRLMVREHVEFNPWTDMWNRETAVPEGQSPPIVVGKRQFEHLKSILKAEGANPNLYIMHNWISDGSAHERLGAFDHELGRFVAFLKETGIYDRALIVVLADTGHEKGWGDWGRRSEFKASPDLLKILALIKRPAGAPGRVIRAPLRQIDILPTVLSHLKMDARAYGMDGVPVTDPRDKSTLSDRLLHIYLTTKAGPSIYTLEPKSGMLLRQKRDLWGVLLPD